VAPTAQLTPTHSPATARYAHRPLRLLSLWHLLSLDAPTVAVLWTWFLAAATHVAPSNSSLLAMALAVWILYATDRLLDARLLHIRTYQAAHPDLQPRHFFHHHHRRAFRTGIGLCALALAVLLPRLSTAAIHLDLALGTLLLAYFLLIHAPRPTHVPPTQVPKELAVGLFFSAATFIPTVAHNPALRPTLLPAALLFALLCSLNCLFIHSWEFDEEVGEEAGESQHLRESRDRTPPSHPATRFAVRHRHTLACFTTLASMVLAIFATIAPSYLPPWPIDAAIALASLLLLLLDRLHRTVPLPPTPLRAAADLCLVTPLLFVPLLLLHA
jgi:hypothetical protein